MTSTPFDIARNISNNLGQAFQQRQDSNTIEQILAKASEADDPQVMQQTIGKILSNVSPQNQQMAFQLLSNASDSIKQRKQEQQKIQAAQQGGYSAYAPPGVQAKQAGAFENQRSYDQFFGAPQAQQAPQQQIPGAQIDQRQQQSMIPDQGMQPQQIQAGMQPQQQENPFANLSDDRLVVAQANPNPYIAKGAKAEADRRSEANKNIPGKEYSKIREKNIAEYVDNAFSKGQEAEDLTETIDIAEKAIEGDITEPGFMATVKNNPYGQLMLDLTPDEATLQSTNKTMLAGSKGIFGSKPTEKEIFLLLNSMLPSIGKSKEANRASLKYLKRMNDMKIDYANIVDELTEGGQKFVSNLERQVNARMKPKAEKLKSDLQKSVEKLSPEDKKVGEYFNKQIKVKAPDGKGYNMSQSQIDAAKAKGVTFEPIK